MKSLLHKIFILGLIGTTSFGTVFFSSMGIMPAFALTQAEIVDILSTVPVFIIVNGQGAPLTTIQTQNDQQVERLVVFIYGSDAESYLANQDSLGTDARVASVWLSDLYERTQAAGGGGFAYIPNAAAVEAATAINEEFAQGVPLFVAQTAGSYLSIRQEGERRVPMFFSRADLQVLLNQLEVRNPEAAAEVTINVLSLETVIRAMENADAEELRQIRFFTASEVINYLQN